MNKKTLKVISMFSGCGGMDLGFLGGFRFLDKEYEKHNIEIIWANELNHEAAKTYQENISKNIIIGDIWDNINNTPNKADILIGGFPCQDISINGKGKGIAGEKSGLYRAMLEVAKKSNPKIIIAENVKGLLMKNHKNDLETIINNFQNLGYKVNYYLVNAADFGVPQTRERVIIVARKAKYPELEFKKVLGESNHLTAHDAIHDLIEIDENQEWSHIWSKANRSPDQGSRRLLKNRAGYTIRAECHGNIQWHYQLERRISMREAARIQSFPDNFIFKSKLRATERQIGNAVPPVLAWHIASSVIESINNAS